MNILEITKQFTEEINKTNSTLDKKKVLAKYPEMKELLEEVYNPFKQYYITSKTIQKNNTLTSDKHPQDIFELLILLNSRTVTGHEAIGTVNNLVEANKQYEQIIYNIIDKDLKCRTGIKIINDVFPKLIPTFEVALANNFKDISHRIDVTEYYASHKLDGCRCITSIDDRGEITFYSREGKEFDTLDLLRQEIKKMNLRNVILDGEICIVDDSGNENFQGIMKLIKRKDFTIPNPKYLVFDQIKYEDFYNQYSDTIMSERQEYLRRTLQRYSGNYIAQVEQIRIRSIEHLTELTQSAYENNWEGLILRKDTVYEGKRSNSLLKVKKMEDAEYIVKDIEVDLFRIIEAGVEKTIETLSAVIIEHKGNTVSVGSGFSLAQRKEYYNNPDKIIGKTITVQYFEETQNQNGSYSLRFPVFKINHGDKRTV